ncbi:MAG: flavodoxin [Bacteroidales bacterium]|nr:flavodoxin [Bacteroidales bacterium]MDD3664967.1 flavodoxin [Bacteroidales bacterium]
MKKIAVLYWPAGGNTEEAARKIFAMLGEGNTIASLDEAASLHLADFDCLIAGGATTGAETWEKATTSNNWSKFFAANDNLMLSSKKVALFGLGDQVLYPNHFVDQLEYLRDEFAKRGAEIIGRWPVEGYKFEESRSVDDGHFFGLALDDDNQPELTGRRIAEWVNQIKREIL